MKELIVPANMALQWELFPGFGKKELLRTATVSGFAALVLWIGTLIHIWNALIAIAAFLFIVTFSVQLFARTVFNTSLFDQLTHEVVRTIEIKGQVEGSAQATLDNLKAQNNMDIQMQINASYTAGGNRIQFGDSFSVTLTYTSSLSVGGIINIPIPLHSTVTGRSEVYWK